MVESAKPALGIVGARRRRVPKRSAGMEAKAVTPESPTHAAVEFIETKQNNETLQSPVRLPKLFLPRLSLPKPQNTEILPF